MMGEIDFVLGLQLLGLTIIVGWILSYVLPFICTLCIKAYKLLMYLISMLIAQITETKRHRKKR